MVFEAQWLEGFANETELSWWIFALSGLLALGIALLTVLACKAGKQPREIRWRGGDVNNRPINHKVAWFAAKGST